MTVAPGTADRGLDRYLTAARAGDERGFTGLYRDQAGKVAAYVRSRGVRDVDDVVNEVFLGAFRNLDTFEGDGTAFRAWLFGIAWNKTADWHRRASRRPVVVDDPTTSMQTLVGGDSEHDAVQALASDDVERMLYALTDDQRNVLLLRIVADLSLEEAASILGKPVGAVKSLQRRALASLQRSFSPEAVSP
ncbi:MAG: RNA polymerase sigma factor [Acidimicrobiales bacterium]